MTAIDLHIHSEQSCDGEFAVREIVDKCREAGLWAFALTDHNTVAGDAEAAELAEAAGIRFLPGIEIDCNYRGTDMHLLGYGIDWKSGDFATLERSYSDKMLASLDEMIHNIQKLGFVVDADAVVALAAGKLPTPELIAELMLSDERYFSPQLRPYMEGGSRSDMPYINFYLDYFTQGRPAFVLVEYMDFRAAVELVCDNGGTPVVAHPGLNFRDKERLVEELLAHGAAGVEVFNNYHTADQAAYFAALAQGRNAFMTCGSDFHGKTKPRIGIGQFASDTAPFEEQLLRFVNHVNVISGQGV